MTMKYPFPDTLDFTTNDILVCIGWNIALNIFFICSEDILEWVGIPNDHIAKEQRYDILINRREYTSHIAIALTTPLLLANVLRMLTSILGLGPIGGYMTWIYILYLYYYRYTAYNVHYSARSYLIYSVSVFLLAYVSWIPGDMMYNVQQAIMYIVALCMARISIGFVTPSSSFVMIHPVQHILWDPLLSFHIFKDAGNIDTGLYDWVCASIY